MQAVGAIRIGCRLKFVMRDVQQTWNSIPEA